MKFDRLSAFQKSLVPFGLSGSDLGVYLNGKCIYREQSGYADVSGKRSFTSDTLFPMYSMTKPVTCACALSMYEDGLFLMDDKLSDYLPEFSAPCVKAPSGEEHTLAQNAIKLKHLFTMSAGFNYNYNSPAILELFGKNKRFTARELANALSKAPLDFEPGTRFQYSFCHDVLGVVLECIENKRLSSIMNERIFEPLQMKSACFHPNEEQKQRLALTYPFEKGVPARNALKYEETILGMCENCESGGAGLFMTLDDYAKFANALAMGGVSPDTGKRILSSGVVRAMAENQLNEIQLNDFRKNTARAGYGYGYGVRTLMSPGESMSAGSAGEFGWSGMAGTYLLIDPKKKLVIVYCQSSIPAANGYLHRRIRNLVYSAIEK